MIYFKFVKKFINRKIKPFLPVKQNKTSERNAAIIGDVWHVTMSNEKLIDGITL